tara:strand:+ start:766 stop:1077 length:312 start_codon:yes stop_codon:yes gene_type:complete
MNLEQFLFAEAPGIKQVLITIPDHEGGPSQLQFPVEITREDRDKFCVVNPLAAPLAEIIRKMIITELRKDYEINKAQFMTRDQVGDVVLDMIGKITLKPEVNK